MPDWLSHLFSHYGYAVIFVGVLLENAGVPAPGHTVTVAGGVLAQQGVLSLPLVVAMALTAAIAGDNAGFWLGRRSGRRLVERHGRVLHLTPARIAWIDDFYRRHGARTVVIARFVTGLQSVAALFAGMSRMPWPRFLLYSVLGATTWSLVYSLAGYLFGQSWHSLHTWLAPAVLLTAAVLFAAWHLVRMLRRHERQRAREVEESSSVQNSGTSPRGS